MVSLLSAAQTTGLWLSMIFAGPSEWKQSAMVRNWCHYDKLCKYHSIQSPIYVVHLITFSVRLDRVIVRSNKLCNFILCVNTSFESTGRQVFRNDDYFNNLWPCPWSIGITYKLCSIQSWWNRQLRARRVLSIFKDNNNNNNNSVYLLSAHSIRFDAHGANYYYPGYAWPSQRHSRQTRKNLTCTHFYTWVERDNCG